MKNEAMERLLIDRRLGELSADTEQLLDAYLQAVPGAASVADEIDEILTLAGRALPSPARPAPEELPPFPVRSATTAARTSRRLQWFRSAAVAAAVVLAFFLGTRTATSPLWLPPERTGELAQSTPSPTANELFWTVQRYVSRGGARSESVKWMSPLVWPRVNERS